MTHRIVSWAGFLILAIALLVPAGAGEKGKKEEKDITNYVAQKKAGKDVKKLVFVADEGTHGPKGNHEFLAGAVYMAKTINAAYDNAYAVVHTKARWPKELEHADAIIVLLNHGGSAVNPAVEAAMKRGAGFMAVHYGVEVNKGEQGKAYLNWLGGYFEPFWSVNPWWTPEFKELPKHEVTRGVKPFSVKDEWYYHMRFVKDMKGITPILSAVAPTTTVNWRDEAPSDGAIRDAINLLKDRKDKSDKADQARIAAAIAGLQKLIPMPSSHGGNPDVYKAVADGKAQHVAWAFEREDGGRGFGFTGYHNYDNLRNDSFRTLLLNAVAWTSKLEVPEKGVPSQPLTEKDLEAFYIEGQRLKK